MKRYNEDVLPGGKADNKSDRDFDPKKLQEGAKHELEHTNKKKIAKEIAKDHLVEDKQYYKKLKEIEKHDRLRIDREADGKQELDFGVEDLEKDKSRVANNQDAQNDYDILMRLRNKKKKALHDGKKIVETLDKDESKGGVSNNQDSNNDRNVLDKWRKLKKAMADDAFMSIGEEEQQPNESESSPENQQQGEQPEEAQQSDQSQMSEDSDQQAPQEDMSDEEMHGILAQAGQGDEEQSNPDTESDSDQQAPLKENELPQEEQAPQEGESNQSDPDTESEQPSEESLEELMSQLGYSDAEIAHVIHGHHFPDVDELQDAKADTERAKKEGELSLQELEMKIKQGEHELKSGGAEKLNQLDVDHKAKMQELEVEHNKRIKELEYEKAKRKAQAEDDVEHKNRLRDLEYEKAKREAQANDEVEHKGRMREVEHTKALKDIPGDKFDDTEHQKRMMDLEHEKAKREMELDLEIKKQQSELKMKQMMIDAEVRQKEKAQAVKENAQAKRDEHLKKNSDLAKSEDISGGAGEEVNPLMNRYEDKYILSSAKLPDFTLKLSEKLKEGDSDTAVRYNRNRTIYLDNRDLDSFRDNIEGIRPRFKVRIRQYKPTGGEWEDTAFVELKIKKEDGFTKKVRIRIPAGLVPYISDGHEIKLGDYLSIINKDITKIELWKRVLAINTTIAKYNFRKQLVVEYNRRAYSNDEIRVTIDDSLKYYNFSDIEDGLIESILDSDNWKDNYKTVKKIKDNDYMILEVKHTGTVPGWLEDLMDETKVKGVKFSKYSAAVMTYIVNGGKVNDNIQRQKINTEELFRALDSYDSLSKGIKEAVLAGTMALSPMSIPEQDAPKAPIVSTPIVDKATQVKNVYNDVAKRNPILGAIGAHESTKGERYNKHHMTTTPGMHFGHTAGGAWGMMPIDVAELINKDKDLAAKYPDMVGLTKDVKANHKHITAQLNDNPEMAATLAEAKLNHNKARGLSNDELIHSWYHGLTGTLNAKKSGHNVGHDSYVRAVKGNLGQSRVPASVKKSEEEWGTCKSFNSSLTPEELAKRNMFIDE